MRRKFIFRYCGRLISNNGMKREREAERALYTTHWPGNNTTVNTITTLALVDLGKQIIKINRIILYNV